ncbi:MAG: DUF4468 domain-containing protein [Prevotella sp.]|nr:DUF4468 domain-containing protein [Prevotella sp.]
MKSKKLMIMLLSMLSLSAWAQDNTWERPEEEQVEEKQQKPKVDQKYLQGAVPLVDGKVVFSKHIDAKGKTATEIYNIVRDYMDKMTRESNQLPSSKLITEDAADGIVAGAYEEWLVFKKNAISLDRTRFIYALKAECKDGGVDISLSHIRYLYDEARELQRYQAESWITDKEAVNKKNTKLLPISGKFRRKTIDRKDFLFNKIESLLK